MSRRSFSFLRWLPLLGLLLVAGCSDGDRVKTATEIDEPAYREGQALLKSGRKQEALTAFLKVIDKRSEDAPESHLEAGMLYAQHINNPLAAIYHFQKYLALRPNSPQAPLIRQRIDAATRDFARTLPAQPLENQLQRVDLVAAIDKLKQENEALKQELADVKAGRAAAIPSVSQPSTLAPVGSASGPARGFSFSTDTVPTVRTRAAPPPVARPSATPTRPTTAAPTRPAPTTQTPAPATGNRRHTVGPGDTLFKLAQQYYGDRSRWKDIYAANRNVMKSDTDLKAGMVLRIP